MCQSCEDSELFCLCRQPLGDNELYLGCEGCEGWFHPSCCGISKKQATRLCGSNVERGGSELDDEDEGQRKFFCPDCQKNQLAMTSAITGAAIDMSSQSLLLLDVGKKRSLSSQSRHADATQRKMPTVVVVPAPFEDGYYYGSTKEPISALSLSALSRPSDGAIGSSPLPPPPPPPPPSSSSLPLHLSSSSSVREETPLFVAPIRGAYKGKKSHMKTTQKMGKPGVSTAEKTASICLSSSSSSLSKNKFPKKSPFNEVGEVAAAHTMPFELVRVKGSTWPPWSEPANSLGRRGAEELRRVCGAVLAEMRFLDAHGTFAEPVPLDLVEGYAQAILQPMDLGTMQTKVNAIKGDDADADDANVSRRQRKKRKAVKGYASIAEFRRDLRLVIENCLTWNVADSDFYNDAKALDAAAHPAFLRASGQASHSSFLSHSDKGGQQTKKARR